MKRLEKTTKNGFSIIDYLSAHYIIRKNSYTNQVIIQRKADQQTINKYDLILELEKANIRISKSWLNTYLKSSQIPEFSPYLETINNLPEWNVTDESEVKKLCSYIETDEKGRLELLLFKWLVNSLLQITGKGINDVMLIFVSQQKQGIGKTFLVRKLMSILPYIQTGQSILKNHENLPEAAVFYPFIFYDELNNLKSESQLLLFKTIISSEQIEYRKFQQIFRRERIANFIGTADSSDLLFDPSGSRRFAIIEIDKINFDYSNKIDFLKIWSEAYFYVKNNIYKDFLWTQEDYMEFERYNAKYYKTTNIEFFINEYLEQDIENGEMLTSGEIIMLLSKITKSNSIIQKADVRSVGFALKKLGFKQYYTRRDGKKGRYYFVKVKENYKLNTKSNENETNDSSKTV